MDERQLQRKYVMEFFCRKEDEGGLGYQNVPSGQVNPDLFIPSDMETFLKHADEAMWNRMVEVYKGNKEAMLADLRKVIKAKIQASKNVATFLNSNKTIGFAGETVPLFYVSGSELKGDEDFKKNIFSAVEETSHTFRFGDKKINAIRPDICFFVNGIFIGYLELKTALKGQTAKEHGRRKIAKDYLSTIKGIAERTKEGPVVYNDKVRAEVMAIFEKAIHLTTSDINETYVLRGISNFYDAAFQDFMQATPHTIDEMMQGVMDVFKIYPVTSPLLTQQERFEEVMRALYSKRMIEKEILYYNFIEYKYVKKNGKRTRTSNTGHLISPRPKQKFGCDKIMGRIDEMLTHEQEPDYYTNKLRRELKAQGTPDSKIDEIINIREHYCNNKYVYSLLMQYAAGFGKSNIIGWLALQLKDYRYEGKYAYNKVLLVVDRLQLRDQLDTMMMNMNIDKSMFVEAVDSDTFVRALDEQERIIVVNIQKFLDMQTAINRSERKLEKMRVAFLIDEIHRSNTGDENQEMIDIFTRLQQTFSTGGQTFAKKNLLVGFTATPNEKALTRFGEFHSATTQPMWMPFDCYTMREAIADGYILDPTKHIITYAVPVEFRLPPELEGQDEIVIHENKEKVYAFEPRMRKIAEFIVERLVSLVYGKIRGKGKAMLAVSSIPNAIKYCNILRELYAEKCKEKKYEKYKDAPISVVYSNSQGHELCSQMNYGLNEETVISNFKNMHDNGLIIVVDKLQTGFDEPKLHTLFLDKEITDINAIQTISRVNRTCKYKEECHVIDFSHEGVNRQNIKEAFKKYCDMVVSDFNPEEEARLVEMWYRGLTGSEPFRGWYSKYLLHREEPAFMLSMEDGIRNWIKRCCEQEEAARKHNQENELKPGDEGYQEEENAASNLRWLIGRYGAAIMDLQDVFEIDEKYYDEVFLSFWAIYCHLYRQVTRKDDDAYEYEVVDSDELPGITMTEDEEKETGGHGGGHRGPTSPTTPKAKSIEEVLQILQRMNEKERIKAQLARIWLREIGLMFQHIKADEQFIAYVKDPNYSEEDKLEEYRKIQNKYRRGLRNRPNFEQVEMFKQLLNDNVEQLFAIFMKDYKNVESGHSDFDYDTTEHSTAENSEQPFNIKDILDEAIQKIRPKYDETLVKEAIVENYSNDFEPLSKNIRAMDEVVDNLMMVLNKKTLDNLDGIDEVVKDALNMVCRAEKLKPVEKRQYLTTLLIKYETYLKKLYYLMTGKEVPAQEEGQEATLSNAIYAIRSLWNLKNTTNPAYKAFYDRLNMLRDLRNTESHGSINISENEIDVALRVIIDMYLFVTATNITELEMAGHYPDVESTASVVSMPKEDIRYGMAAEAFVDARELSEEQRIDVLRKSLIQLFNHGGYKASDKTFCKQRHWLSVYRIAADEGFIIEGDFRYFKHIINDMNLSDCKVVLNIDTLERSVKGIYSTSFTDWNSDTLFGKNLDEYNDIHHCAEVFLQILCENRPKKAAKYGG